MLTEHHPLHNFRDMCCGLHNVTCNDCQLRCHKASLGLCRHAPVFPQEYEAQCHRKSCVTLASFPSLSLCVTTVRKQGIWLYQPHSLADRLFEIQPLLEQVTHHSNACLILRQNHGQRKSPTSKAVIARGTWPYLSQEFLASQFSGNKGVLLNDSPKTFLGQYITETLCPRSSHAGSHLKNDVFLFSFTFKIGQKTVTKLYITEQRPNTIFLWLMLLIVDCTHWS